MLSYGGYFLVGEAHSPSGPDNPGVLHGLQPGLYLRESVGLDFG